MSIIVKKNSSVIFSPPSYIKGKKKSVLEKKVDEIINDVIKEKVFSLLCINRLIYFKKIEYFPIFTINQNDGEKSLLSIMMRVKNKQKKFKKIKAKEIEMSGVEVIEFHRFLEDHGAKEIFNAKKMLEIL